MAISIRNPEAERLAKQVAEAYGISMTRAIIDALEEKLKKVELAGLADAAFTKIMNISRRCAALPDFDTRSEDEILGYDDSGALSMECQRTPKDV